MLRTWSWCVLILSVGTSRADGRILLIPMWFLVLGQAHDSNTFTGSRWLSSPGKHRGEDQTSGNCWITAADFIAAGQWAAGSLLLALYTLLPNRTLNSKVGSRAFLMSFHCSSTEPASSVFHFHTLQKLFGEIIFHARMFKADTT